MMKRLSIAMLGLAWACLAHAQDAPATEPPADEPPAVPATLTAPSIVRPVDRTTPPRMMAGHCTRAEYPVASARAKESGTTVMQVTVDSEGTVMGVVVTSSSGSRRLYGAAKHAMLGCKFWPGRNAADVAVKVSTPVKHTWRLEDAAPDPWLPLQAAAAKGTWTVTEDLSTVAFTSPSRATPGQRAKILQRLREASLENARCAHIESIAAGPVPPAWTRPVTDPKTGLEIPTVAELWKVRQCGIDFEYGLVMRFPADEPATFSMFPIGATADPAPAAPKPTVAYADRVAAALRPNIAYTASGRTPVTEAELKLAPDGRIIQFRLVKASDDPAWNRAVQAALAATTRVPLDDDGKAPPVVVVTMRAPR
jgi:TonB family protein